jgi:hypothetical protein
LRHQHDDASTLDTVAIARDRLLPTGLQDALRRRPKRLGHAAPMPARDGRHLEVKGFPMLQSPCRGLYDTYCRPQTYYVRSAMRHMIIGEPPYDAPHHTEKMTPPDRKSSAAWPVHSPCLFTLDNPVYHALIGMPKTAICEMKPRVTSEQLVIIRKERPKLIS